MSVDPKRVKELFLGAIETEDEAVRIAYLDHACGEDAELRERVEALLRSHNPEDSFLQAPAAIVPNPDMDATIAYDAETDDDSAILTSDEDFYDLRFLTPASRPDSLGRLGHYEILQVLGKGGFGIVFRAFDDVLQRVVAIKVLAPEIAATSPARKRFLREARSSAAVRHENVVQVYEVGEQPLPYLVMEFIPGETLQQRLDRMGPLDVPEVLQIGRQIGRQIAEGLAAAHASDLIHRDIKPGNMLLEGGHHKVKITDFGLARAADDASMTQSGMIAGTPMYMAPEQALGDTIDQRADLFSLGSVLYQMVAGRPPFRASTTLAVLKRVAEDNPRSIREIIPETPNWLCDIIAKLHAKDPKDRYQSAREVADVLANCEEQLKAKNLVESVVPAAVKPTGRKWTSAAAVLLLPVIALAVTEYTGVTHLFRNPQVTHEPIKRDDRLASPHERIKRDGKLATAAAAESKESPTIAPFTDADIQRIAALPAAEQVEEVRKELMRLNPGFDGKMDTKINGGVVREFRIVTDQVTDIAPIRVWNTLWLLSCSGPQNNGKSVGRLEDLTPLEGMNLASLNYLDLTDTPVTDAGMVYFKDCKNLSYLNLAWTKVTDKGLAHFKDCKKLNILFVRTNDAGLAHFKDCKALTRLHLRGAKVTDAGLVHFKDMPLKQLWIDGTGVSDLTPLEGMPLEVIYLTPKNINRGLDILRDMKSLNTIGIGPGSNQVWPAAKFWERYDKGEFASAPFTDADVQRIAALPANEQVEEVRKELMRRNPGFDGTIQHKIEGGVVTEINGIVTDQVTDIAPIRVWSDLRVLDLDGTNVKLKGNGQLADLSPLAGMKLPGLRRVNLSYTMVGDAGLVHFKDCSNLTHLDLVSTQVTGAGLAYFKECTNLTHLGLGRTQVNDAGLVHFKNCKMLTRLDLSELSVGDVGLGYFQECENLTVLGLGRTQVTDAGLARFKDCKKLQSVNLLNTKVGNEGLAYLKDCKELTRLHIGGTKVTDLSLIKDLPLKELDCPFRPERDAEILRSIKTLEKINGKPAAEFWKEVEE